MTSRFVLPAPPLLSGAVFDRADDVRDAADRIAQGWNGAYLLLIDTSGRYPVLDTGGLHWLPATEISDEPPPDAVFLGITHDGPRAGAHLWTRRVHHLDGPTTDPRRGAALLDREEAGILATALGVLNWHSGAGFSPVDGAPLEPARGGWVRRHMPTGRDEFPRTDPAVITVVHDDADRILLGRQAIWPQGWYSTLAGFVEPGESLEQCVIREVREEVGITVTDPRYLGSQPWPFPRSLMVGFEAIADPTHPLDFVDGEIADAVWFHRDEVLEALARGDEWGTEQPAGAPEPRLRLPGSISIARTMIDAWAHAG